MDIILDLARDGNRFDERRILPVETASGASGGEVVGSS
jgi:hypothetical protein